jgi:WD40 repeat protein
LATSVQEAQTVARPILLTQSPSEIEFTDLTGFKGVIVTLEVSPDGDILLVASNDGQITAIDLSNFQTIYSLPIKANPYSDIVFSSDGQFFTVAEQQVVFVYETSTGNLIRTLREHTGNVGSLAISSDDRILVSASGQDLTLKIWDLETGELLQNIGEDVDSVSTVAFHPDGNLFVTGAGGIGSDRTVKYWGVAQDSTLPTYELVKVSPKQFGFIYDLTFDSEGEKLVGAVRNYVKVWEINRNSAEILSVKASPLEINRVAISPNSRLIATANRDNTITLIDANQKKIIGTLTGHQGWIQSITFSPDGNTLYSGAEDKIVKIWDISRF